MKGHPKKVIIFAVLLSLLISINLFQVKFKNFVYFLSAPLQKNLSKAGKEISNFFEVIFKMKDLEKQNKTLLIENQELKSQTALLKELEKENKILRESLELGLQEDFQLSLSYIISKDPFRDSILINKGARDGTFEDMVVVTPQKALLGKVEKVYDNFSRVRLITDKGFSFSGRIQPEIVASETTEQSLRYEDVTGIIKGGGNFELFFDLIPQEAKIQTGQQVVTISLDGAFPKGLFVGEIESIEKSDLQPYQRAKIKPAFDLTNLEFVFVILNY